MSLDPVHFEGIARLAARIDGGVDDDDHDAFAETAWREFLDPLRDGGRTLVEPLDDRTRRRAPIEGIALAETGYDEVHGIDAGSLTPTRYRNGVTLDVAQAVMSARPTDLPLHRSRTVVAAVHTNDATASIPREWTALDDDHTRVRAIDVPAVDRRERTVVGTLALYQAESDHALAHLDAVSELLVLDGPIYPKGLVRWRDRDPDLAALLERERRVREPIENYVRLVEAAIEADIALAGFVKNPASKVITRAVRSIGASAPWVDDAAFFERVLRHEGDDDLTVTNWFRARGGADAPFASDGAAFGVDRDLDPEAYEVTFCAVFDPRTDLLYRIEAPYAVTRDPERRDRLTRHLLSEVAAAGGPPAVVDRADQLAGIGSRERRSLRGRIGDAFDSSPAGSYDRYRWG